MSEVRVAPRFVKVIEGMASDPIFNYIAPGLESWLIGRMGCWLLNW